MTVQLFEGCWGVTRGRGKRGSIKFVSDDIGGYRWGAPPYAAGLWNANGSFALALHGTESQYDIIAVFATEAEADAYLAGEPAEARVRASAEKPPESDALARMGENGATWAAEFREMALRLGYSAMDEGWLIGWFANAIEAGRNHSASAPAPPAPKPVTWPDGVGTIELFGGDTVTVAGGYVVINHGLLSLKSAKARQLAALLLAAADKVEGRG